MPGYYQRSLASQMPLTPPDSGSGYSYSNMHYSQEPYMQPGQQCRQDAAYDFQGAYLPPPAAPAYPYPSTTLPPIQGYYEPMGAPILPPLRIQDGVPFADDYQRRLQQNAQDQQEAISREQQRQQATKEEKATGGVSAKLDYEMERMTDFVTEAAQSIFQHQMQSTPSFRKWVHQVLSATRLPSATILLALHYLNDRVANYPASIAQGENQIYRLLAVALILGSKFLDDNTFINRSWSDVTAIKVTELNALETKWLHLIHYELHIEPTAPNGLQAWMDAWHKYNADWLIKQEYAAKQQTARLSPLDTTNVHRHTSSSRDRYSPYPTPSYSAPATARSFDAPLSSRSSQFSTPYSASDPWAPSERQGLDDYYKPPQRYPSFAEADSISRRVSPERAPPQTAYYAPSAHPSYYQTPTYSSWDQNAWNNSNHRYDCNCSTCMCQQHYRPYQMATNYPQPVMG